MKRKAGFTLIELLVVIAIISLLSSIVLASLAQARIKARDAAVISALTALRGQAEINIRSDGSYGDGGYIDVEPSGAYTCDESSCTWSNVCNDPKMLEILRYISATSGNHAMCTAVSTQGLYIVGYGQLPSQSSGQFYCVDSYGFSGKRLLSEMVWDPITGIAKSCGG